MFRGSLERFKQRAHLPGPFRAPGHAPHRDALRHVQRQAVQPLAQVQQGRGGHLGRVVVLAGDPVHGHDGRVFAVQGAGQQRRVRTLVDAVRRASHEARLLPGHDHA